MLVGHKIGPFVVDKELGAGAMGAVYRARHTESGQRVAIKIVSPNLASNETAMARFKREAAILKQLNHPNIVRLVATGKFNSMPFYAMEYVEGESLDRVMARRDRITWEHMVALGQQLCAALQHAHDLGIVHRDLKPSNLMVLADDTVKLTDFGIAKDLDVTALTEANCTVGTAAYMSPEQCRGERNLTHKSDLYSMGVMFFELLSGKKPFSADNPMEMFMKHVGEKPPRVSQLVDVPPWLDTLIDQLLAKKPEHRPMNAAAVGEALNRVLEKVEARQSAGYDAARARVADRLPEQRTLSDADKETARVLLRKKKRREAAVPFYRSGWFLGIGLVAMLAAIGAVFYFAFLRRPSPADLYAQAKALMATDDLEKWKEARNGPVKEYLDYYGDRDDDQANAMRRWDAVAWETELLRRYRDNQRTGEADPDEPVFRKAIAEEDQGQLSEARTTWGKLGRGKDEKDRDKRSHSWVAQDRLRRLDEVEALEKRLSTLKIKDADERERKAIDALKSEKAREVEKAREQWESLLPPANERDDLKNRPWYLLAKKHLHLLEQKKTARRAPPAPEWRFAARPVMVATEPAAWRRPPCPPPSVTAAGRRSPAPAT
jgi:serine/threonine-protein kinase